MTKARQLEFDVASALALGTRSRQEDALAVAFPDRSDLGFAVVSDGMGGHSAGDVASRTIVAEIFADLTIGNVGACPDVPLLLRDAVTNANESLRACVRARPDQTGMGGTVVATMVAGDRLHWVSVGDSMLYLFRNETLSRLNDDHSMAPQLDLMVSRGMITPAEARSHPQRHALTSALWGAEIAEIDCPDTPLRLQPDDVIILASDGLQFLPDPIIEALLLRARRDSSRDIIRDLIDAVETLDDPEQDNTSIIVIRANTAKARTRPKAIQARVAPMMKAFRRAFSPAIQVRERG